MAGLLLGTLIPGLVAGVAGILGTAGAIKSLAGGGLERKRKPARRKPKRRKPARRKARKPKRARRRRR